MEPAAIGPSLLVQLSQTRPQLDREIESLTQGLAAFVTLADVHSRGDIDTYMLRLTALRCCGPRDRLPNAMRLKSACKRG